MNLKKALAEANQIIKILDPDYFLCRKCKEYQHISVRCKEKSLGFKPRKLVPSTHPLCIDCSDNKQGWWEWKFEESEDIVSLCHIDLQEELIEVMGEQIEVELSELK